MPFAAHPGSFLKCDLNARSSAQIGSHSLSAYRPGASRTLRHGDAEMRTVTLKLPRSKKVKRRV